MLVWTDSKTKSWNGMSQLNEKEVALVEVFEKEYRTPSKLNVKLKKLFAGALETMLEAEMDEHLSYEKHSEQGHKSGNSRKGHDNKTMWGRSEAKQYNSASRPQQHI